MATITKKKVLQDILRIMSIMVLKKYKPTVVGITGSVGKTSTKEAIFSVLAARFRTRRNQKNYNNEIGIPLTVIGAESGQDSVLRWLVVFCKWAWIIIYPVRYPEILVLEMGADRPGDIRYLVNFTHPTVGVITDVSESHLEYFKSIEAVLKEKGTLVLELEKRGSGIINMDNAQVAKLIDQLPENSLKYGFSEEADVRATDVQFIYDKAEIKGISFKLNHRGTTIPVRLNGIVSKHHIYAALAAASVGTRFGLNLVEIAAALENFALPCGRMNLIEGIKNTMIIDDSYNASPVSVIAALEVLAEVKAGRKIVVLGDMLELGPENERGHRAVAKKFMEVGGDIFFAVGKRMRFAITELEKEKFPQEKIFHFSDPASAGRRLQDLIREGDLVLVKGSQGMRMEKIIEEIMSRPQKAPELLCRQNARWKSLPFKEV